MTKWMGDTTLESEAGEKIRIGASWGAGVAVGPAFVGVLDGIFVRVGLRVEVGLRVTVGTLVLVEVLVDVADKRILSLVSAAERLVAVLVAVIDFTFSPVKDTLPRAVGVFLMAFNVSNKFESKV